MTEQTTAGLAGRLRADYPLYARHANARGSGRLGPTTVRRLRQAPHEVYGDHF